ncbi:MAG: hypothetical protein WA734_04535 [Candidatus Acidiferrales bacterium]
MSFESFNRPQLLNEAEAREDGDMLRAKLKEMVGHEPTAEDYDRALQAVEEMKKLAEEEPQFDRIFFKMMRIGNKYFQGMADGLLSLLSMDKRPNESDLENRNWHLHMFEDATSRLQELRISTEKSRSSL